MELSGSVTRLRQGYGVPSIEGKAATGSREFFTASVGRELRAVLTFQLFNALTWRSRSCLNLVGGQSSARRLLFTIGAHGVTRPTTGCKLATAASKSVCHLSLC